ncbi:Jag N-terminal domain-containing protein [Campylobacter sp.]|uniref:Jag N-terminal domain-containing protein n=1 Tax=Campylobacter sp. TaxID=205 RepID=UPI002708979F|nr:Jag N-terminal domain-containing protein [Campylobacter sp.]
MRIEANTLQEAFRKAAEELNCSVTELDIKVIQNPSIGFLGFFKKTAIIEAVKEGEKPKNNIKKHKDKREKNGHRDQKSENLTSNNEKPKEEKSHQKSEKQSEKPNGSNDKKRNRNKKRRDKEKRDEQNGNSNGASVLNGTNSQKTEERKHAKDISIDPFALDEPIEKESINLVQKSEEEVALRVKKDESKNILDNSIIDTFHKDFEGESSQKSGFKQKEQKPKADIDAILPEVKDGLAKLFNASCFDISDIKASKFDDETVLIELNGEDAALLIGKEGCRYKAISYLIYNWINSKYNLSLRLEIAEFLKNQEAAIDQYLQSVIQKIEDTGRAKTKPLDGILAKIALEKLRDRFPDKYVAIKIDKNKQFVVVNEFLKKS